MKFETFVLVLGLSTALGTVPDLGRPRILEAVSGRDAESTSDATAAAAAGVESQAAVLYSLVDSLLESAKTGITAANLDQAASEVQAVADAIVKSQGGEVNAAKVHAEIEEAAGKFNGAVAVSSLFDEPLTYEANKLDAALCLLNNLANKARQEEVTSESAQPIFAAISRTARAIQTIVMDTVGFILLNAEETAAKTLNKRRITFGGHFERHSSGRYSFGGRISYSSGRGKKRKRSSQAAHSVTKRGHWHVNLDWSGPSVSYSWRR